MAEYLFASPLEVHDALKRRTENALLDVREQGEFSRSHTLLASCAPLSRLETLVPDLVPCKKATVYLMDGGQGDDRAERAGQVLVSLGYENVIVMTGGMAAWLDAGLVKAEGVGALSKGFGEYVEKECQTPRLEPQEVHALLHSDAPSIVIDVRPQVEYARMNIPGSINLPGCEVTYRFADAVPDPETTVIINCAGRTRSIIGTQTLINAGIPNKVYALKGGTMNWQLAGFDLEYGSTRRTAPPSPEAFAVARGRAASVAERYGVRFIDAETLRRWQDEAEEKTLYLFDVRLPDEYRSGHIPGSRNAQGGQLVQATDEYAAVRNGRFVLIDDTEVRAVMTAHWLGQMGLPEVYVLRGGLGGSGLGSAGLVTAEKTSPLPQEQAGITPLELAARSDALVIDTGTSTKHKQSHIPGAVWCVRAKLDLASERVAKAASIVFTADTEYEASLAAEDARALWPEKEIAILQGGTAQWVNAGLPTENGIDALCPVEDVWYRPYTDVNATPEAMRGYFDWEFGLVECIERDGCARFHV
ncbi:MAG: hypothetical protein IJB29_03815 [Mailhella sp.]|nr:hypothetical protein [Mailhella sp.]